MRELKNCPFCGDDADIKSRYVGFGSLGLGSHDMFYVKCKTCGARSDENRDEQMVIAAWNRRNGDA